MWITDWTARAACKGTDPDELFVQGAAQNRAKLICRGCPVRTECLADALDNRIDHGVWGGMTERERRALLRRRPEVISWRELLEDARNEYERSGDELVASGGQEAETRASDPPPKPYRHTSPAARPEDGPRTIRAPQPTNGYSPASRALAKRLLSLITEEATDGVLVSSTIDLTKMLRERGAGVGRKELTAAWALLETGGKLVRQRPRDPNGRTIIRLVA